MDDVLTIGQLASYAGVSIRAVRHYHHVGLLPDPERDANGYRTYEAAAVVRLIRIRTLAQAGVPLSRVREVLDADAQAFTDAVAQIDRELRAKIAGLQEHRRRIARLDSGDSLALPAEVVDYLDRLRDLGATEEMIAPERDAWILMAARWPQEIPAIMADKVTQLSNPKVLHLYQMIVQVATAEYDDQLLHEAADLITGLLEEAAQEGKLWNEQPPPDAAYTALVDSFAESANPAVARLRELVAERGWTGWTRMEKRDPD